MPRQFPVTLQKISVWLLRALGQRVSKEGRDLRQPQARSAVRAGHAVQHLLQSDPESLSGWSLYNFSGKPPLLPHWVSVSNEAVCQHTWKDYYYSSPFTEISVVSCDVCSFFVHISGAV